MEREFSIPLPGGHFRAFLKRPRLARAALGSVVSFSSSAFCDNPQAKTHFPDTLEGVCALYLLRFTLPWTAFPRLRLTKPRGIVCCTWHIVHNLVRGISVLMTICVCRCRTPSVNCDLLTGNSLGYPGCILVWTYLTWLCSSPLSGEERRESPLSFRTPRGWTYILGQVQTVFR